MDHRRCRVRPYCHPSTHSAHLFLEPPVSKDRYNHPVLGQFRKGIHSCSDAGTCSGRKNRNDPYRSNENRQVLSVPGDFLRLCSHRAESLSLDAAHCRRAFGLCAHAPQNDWFGHVGRDPEPHLFIYYCINNRVCPQADAPAFQRTREGDDQTQRVLYGMGGTDLPYLPVDGHCLCGRDGLSLYSWLRFYRVQRDFHFCRCPAFLGFDLCDRQCCCGLYADVQKGVQDWRPCPDR